MRRVAALLLALVAPAAAAGLPPITSASSPFATSVLHAIYGVVPPNPREFYISRETPWRFRFSGAEPGDEESLECARQVGFVISTLSVDRIGYVGVGACDESVARLRLLVKKAESHVQALETSPWAPVWTTRPVYQVTRSADGAEVIDFPSLVGGGHGAGVMHTVVVFVGPRVFVIQGIHADPSCQPGRAGCIAARDDLLAVARRLQATRP